MQSSVPRSPRPRGRSGSRRQPSKRASTGGTLPRPRTRRVQGLCSRRVVLGRRPLSRSPQVELPPPAEDPAVPLLTHSLRRRRQLLSGRARTPRVGHRRAHRPNTGGAPWWQPGAKRRGGSQLSGSYDRSYDLRSDLARADWQPDISEVASVKRAGLDGGWASTQPRWGGSVGQPRTRRFCCGCLQVMRGPHPRPGGVVSTGSAVAIKAGGCCGDHWTFDPPGQGALSGW